MALYFRLFHTLLITALAGPIAFTQAASYPNVLDIHGVPDSATDRSPFAFFDQGAWHGYALPTKADTACLGGFPLYTLSDYNGRWLSPCFSRLVLRDNTGKVLFKQSDDFSFESHYFPDRLTQEFRSVEPGIQLQVTLTFLSDRTALIKHQFSNNSTQTINLNAAWEGTLFAEKTAFEKGSKGGLLFKFGNKAQLGAVQFSIKTKTSIAGNQYTAAFSSALKPGQSTTVYHTETICFDQSEYKTQTALALQAFSKPEQVFAENRLRWDKMLSLALEGIEDSVRQHLAVKCVETLLSNWRSPAGELQHSGLFPSWHYRGFQGFWAWDSWKHAVALAHFAPKLAKDQMRAMFDFQAPNGMVPDCVFRDTLIEKHNWRDTKPPLASWAVWEIYSQTKDLDFLQEMFPKLEKYNRWWYAYRDHDKDGLCEYGSTDGTLVAAKWESGMDNAVRFDSAQILQNPNGGWSLNQESTDLNAFLEQEARLLAQIARVLGDTSAGTHYKQALQIRKKFRASFFDVNDNWFYDIEIHTGKPIKVKGSEGWTPLFTKSANAVQASKVVYTMKDPELFATYMPFPTLAANRPELRPEDGYWRGPIWIDQAYFAIQGLENYGYHSLATDLQDRFLTNGEGLLNSALPIRENYNPLNGKGLEAFHFSWSAACLLLMLK